MSDRLLHIIGALAHEFWIAILVGNPAPGVAKLRERASHPRPGDLVVEMTTAMHGRGPRPVAGHKVPTGSIGAGIGTLQRKTREPISVEDWNVEEDGPVPTETVWYVERLDSPEVVRWVNANFMAIPPFPEDDR